MFQSRIQEHAVKLVDIDETHPDPTLAGADVGSDADTPASPRLRPEVLGDAAQRRTKAMVRAALFEGTGEAPQIGPYQVLKRLGEGGMGVVYAAYDDKLERKVALKLIRGAMTQRPEGRARTLREARALARLSHPNVVHVYQVGEVDDEIFVAMEFLNGPTLRAWLAAQPRTWREVLSVFRQAGEGLAAAHRQGVVHRDFKPTNVIVGDDGRVRVVDFGLAHFADDDAAIKALPAAGEVSDVLLTQTGAVLGTPAYMAAEQFSGARGDAKADQFSFCAALYEALYGQRPFAGDQLEALRSAVISGRVQPVKASRGAPAWLHRVVTRGLQPDPAARWPSMDALLAALNRPERRIRKSRLVATALSSLALMMGGMGYIFTHSSTGDRTVHAEHEAVAQAQAAAIRAQDEKLLATARAALQRDPVQAVRALAQLAGDEPETWHKARFLAAAAEARGLPEQVLRAGDRPLAEVYPLASEGFIGRDELGAVWRWKMSERTGTEVLAPGSASTALLTARDVPVWAAVNAETVQVFGEGRAQTIDVGALDVLLSEWRLASDGNTLVARSHARGQEDGLLLWDLMRPGAPPTSVALPSRDYAVIADDASVVLIKESKGIGVVRPREGSATTLPYAGGALALSADRRFIIATPDDTDEALDVLELETGKVRRVQAEWAVVLGGSDALFMRVDYGQLGIRRESLATGEVAWYMQAPMESAGHGRRLVVDPAHDQIAVAIGEQWGIADAQRGGLSSLVATPPDGSARWVGEGALMVVVGSEARIHRPAAAPVQVRERSYLCSLAPGGRWAATTPWDLDRGEFARIELATHTTTTFRCPTLPKQELIRSAMPFVDDAGQVAIFANDGWSCWWDEQHGVRTGARGLSHGRIAALPRGVALAEGDEVEVWSGPDERTRQWTVAGPVEDLLPSPSGDLLAVRSAHGVQALRIDSGEAMTVSAEAAPLGQARLNASAMAWSPDSTRLALLDRTETSLALSVWDVAGEPREVGRYDLKDSQGRPRNALTFTPSGEAVMLTHRHKSLMRLDLTSRAPQELRVPDLLGVRATSETGVIGVEVGHYTPLIADFAAAEFSPLTPNLDLGGSTRPEIVRSESGSLWTCAALGPGTLIEVAPPGETSPQATRDRVRELAASL